MPGQLYLGGPSCVFSGFHFPTVLKHNGNISELNFCRSLVPGTSSSKELQLFFLANLSCGFMAGQLYTVRGWSSSWVIQVDFRLRSHFDFPRDQWEPGQAAPEFICKEKSARSLASLRQSARLSPASTATRAQVFFSTGKSYSDYTTEIVISSWKESGNGIISLRTLHLAEKCKIEENRMKISISGRREGRQIRGGNIGVEFERRKLYLWRKTRQIYIWRKIRWKLWRKIRWKEGNQITCQLRRATCNTFR